MGVDVADDEVVGVVLGMRLGVEERDVEGVSVLEEERVRLVLGVPLLEGVEEGE